MLSAMGDWSRNLLSGDDMDYTGSRRVSGGDAGAAMGLFVLGTTGAADHS